MKVTILDKDSIMQFKSTDVSIVVELTEGDLHNIKNMCPDCTKYAIYHEQHTAMVDEILGNLTDEKGGVS